MTGFICPNLFIRCIITDQTCRIVTTSVAEHHLTVLWGEIGRFLTTSKQPLLAKDGGPLVVNHMEIRRKDEMHAKNPLNYLVGRVSAKGEGLAGHHADVTLAVADEACYDQETEVLTREGWKLFDDLKSQDELLTMDPSTREAFYEQPTAIQHYHYEGPMYLYERRCGNFCVTPNHKMLWRWFSADAKKKRRVTGVTGTWKPYCLERIDSLGGGARYIPRCFNWKGEERKEIVIEGTVSKRKCWREERVPTKDWMNFLGWFCSEGNYLFNRGILSGIDISQKDLLPLLELGKRVLNMGILCHVHERCDKNAGSSCLRIHHRGLAEHLWRNCGGRYCWEKRVPRYVGDLPPDMIEAFLESYTEGDGYSRPNRDIIYTSSPGMADDLQILSYKAGREATVHKRSLIGLKAPNGVARHDGYTIARTQLGLDSHLKVKPQHLQRVDYNGMIHCATLPTHHVMFVRRNGVAMWCGNSGVDNSVHDAFQGWSARRLYIGNPLPTTNFFYQAVREGDILADSK